MKQMLKLSLAAAVLAVVGLSAESVKACDGYSSGLTPIHGFGYSGSLYGLGYIPVPPYFALHPPVYYGEQVYRSYGASPFACRCDQVEVSKAQPAMVSNRFVVPLEQPESLLKKEDDRQAFVQPLEIVNPFVETTSVARK